MKSVRCRSTLRSSCCVCCRSARSIGLEACTRFPLMCAWWRLPTATCASWSIAVSFREDLYYRFAGDGGHGAAAARPQDRDSGAGRGFSAAKLSPRVRRTVGSFPIPTRWTSCSVATGPGNIRELRNCVFRAMVLSAGVQLQRSDLDEILPGAATSAESVASGVPRSEDAPSEATVVLPTVAAGDATAGLSGRLGGVAAVDSAAGHDYHSGLYRCHRFE